MRVESESFVPRSSAGGISRGSMDEASEMAEGMEGLETDMETAEPKSEELETRDGGSWLACPVGLVS